MTYFGDSECPPCDGEYFGITGYTDDCPYESSFTLTATCTDEILFEKPEKSFSTSHLIIIHSVTLLMYGGLNLPFLTPTTTECVASMEIGIMKSR